MKKLALAALLGVTAMAPAVADVEKTIEYRQSVYRIVAWNFGPLRAMAQGKMAFDVGAAQRHAERIAQVSLMLDDAYEEPSSGEGSDALPAIWTNRADFDAKLMDFQQSAAALAETAASGDQEATVGAFGKMAGTCKACHDDYKD